ncbi:MAG: extracellular solute-binding protein [Chloroflexaceae bacterium]|jgi:multiple sugar transport system substrate-binding protein|nr:extracellular solute-binding protein [Chloroflexaceae bacterium]
MRRICHWLSVLLIIPLLLAACSVGQAPQPTPGGTPAAAVGTTPAPTGDVVTIGFGAQEWERRIYEPLIEKFNAENTDMRVQFVSLDEVYQTQFDPNNPPDQAREVVSRADTATTFFVDPRDVERNLYYNLTPLIEADPTFQRDDYYPSAFASLTHNGNIYGLPRNINLPLMSYNKDLWAARGLQPPGSNLTWQELMTAAEQLAQKQGSQVETYGMLDFGGFTTVMGEMHAAGVNILTQSPDQVRLDTPEMQAVLEKAASMVESGALYSPAPPGAGEQSSFNPDDMRKLVVDGRVGIWQPSSLPSSSNDPPLPFPVGTIAMPDIGIPYTAAQNSFVMSSGTQHPEQAWRWLSFLSRQSTADEMMHSSNQELPARTSLAEQSKTWQDMDEETKAAVEALLQRPVQPLPAGLFGSRVSAFGPLVEAFNAVLHEKKPADEALREAQTKLQEQVAQVALTPQPAPNAAPVTVTTPVAAVAPAGATSIKFMVMGGDMMPIRKLAESFNQNNQGVFVEIVDPNRVTQRTANSTSVTVSGSIEDMFTQSDCFMSGGWRPDTITQTLDLQPLVQADAAFQLEDYPAALLQPFQKEGRLTGLPYSVRLPQMSYNTKLFAEAGLEPPKASWTPDEFLNAAQQLTKGSGEEKQYGFVSESRPTQELNFFLKRFGAELFTGKEETLQPTFTDPRVVQASRFYIDLLKNTSPHETLDGYSRNQNYGGSGSQIIFSGRAGMWFSYGTIFMSPRMQQPDVAIAPLPIGTGGISSEDYYSDGLFISSQTQHAEACWTWLKFLSEDTSALSGAYPARSSIVDSPAFQGQAQPGALDVYNAYREALSRADASAASERTYDPRMDTFWFYRAVDRALQGNDLERELADAQKFTEDFILCGQAEIAAQGETADLSGCATQVDPTYEGFQQPRPSPAPASP